MRNESLQDNKLYLIISTEMATMVSKEDSVLLHYLLKEKEILNAVH